MTRQTPYLVLLLLVTTGCANGLFYQPDNRLYQTPSSVYEEVAFQSLDGTQLTGWFLPAEAKNPVATIIHFHGNAANISNHYGFVGWLPEAGFNVFLFDYRGYGDSEGHPNRQGVFEDSVAALRYVATRTDVDPTRLIAFGQSLGGANAVSAAAATPEVPLKGVVVDSAFYSYRSIARDKIGLIPILGWFKWPLSFITATNGHSPGPIIARLAPTPVLIIHGTKDRVIPYAQGCRLYQDANAPKAMWTVDGGDHTDALMTHRATYRQRLVRHLLALLRRPESLE
ncbi:alpha/beta hydrolase [Desulfoluna sp.]|uniref:alpha/beta hydrolase n=1 Tax=Desulfoluna sp. TaxID=2045199 RepID=UPI002626C016|nr:alpha/beta hydrolase [Desulfoluna sp.]